ncbi:A-kinase anchor protein 17A [Drosophila obscura]|uniref:A-kinase anchor protein 17A n=1 Tax=Drosophila obscura TaxID=7282 RepID=UPI001BB20C9D|nr:A-kinase anchor protein 17A [Drosophila obscura]
MINIQTIENVADCTPLYLPHSLYLKPWAKMQISVSLPKIKSGKSVSNLEIMDKLSAELKPDKFLLLKVSKSTVDYIRFEAELDERKRLRLARERLDGISLRISGFSESFRVRCAESKDEFPTRHDWDSYFRDARNMDEMKAGERPDTIHLTHLPMRWFCPRHSEHEEQVKPSESIFKRIFEKFGRVRAVDIPICDPYRKTMQSDINGMRTFSFEQDVLFEAYVQFEEYTSFVRAMDEFRGTKLVRKFVDKTQAINICVNFDKQKHLSDSHIQRRERMRKRCIAKAQAEDEERDRLKKQQAEQLERERKKQEELKLAEVEKQREREEKRKEKHLKKIHERGQVEISQKIRIEERKLLIAQRKLESIRTLEKLFERIQLKQKDKPRRARQDEAKDIQRGRLVEKYKAATEKLVCEQRKIVQEIKSNTPLMGLLKSKSKKNSAADCSSDDENARAASKRLKANGLATAAAPGAVDSLSNAASAALNPFKPATAMSVGAVPGQAAYNAEAASEWMQSLSMFGYGLPGVFPGALYRPAAPFPVSSNYRGFAPRPRGRGRGRGAGFRGGRSGYEGSSSYYNPKHDRYGDEDNDNGYHHKSSRGRHRSRSASSYSRSRSRSHGRRIICRSRRSQSRSRSRSRSHYRKSSYSSRSRRTHSRSHSRSRSKTPSQRKNRKLASTRRSRSVSYSRSRSHSRKRSHSRREHRSRHRSRSRSRSHSPIRNHSDKNIVLEADKLVASAEQIQRTIEQHTKDRMREEEREIKQNFRQQRTNSHSSNHVDTKLQTESNDEDRRGGSERSSRRNSLAA